MSLSSSSPRFARWPAPSDDLRTLTLRVQPSRIGLFCSIIEAYEGVTVIRTTDRQLGLLELWIMPGQRSVVDSILDEFSTHSTVMRIRDTPGHPNLDDNAITPKE